MKILVPTLLAFSFPVAAWAAPAKSAVTTTKFASNVSVEPKARAIFARATALYKPLKTLHLQWKTDATLQYVMGGTPFNDRSNYVSMLDYARAGRLKVRNSDQFTPLILVKGKTKWTVLNRPSDEAGQSRPTYRQESINAGGAYDEFQVELATSVAPLTQRLSDFLAGVNPLDVEQVNIAVTAEKLLQLRASVLPSQTTNGQLCDLVRLTKQFLDPYAQTKAATISQETYWFERASGRLVRLQTRTIVGPKNSQSSDLHIAEQTFDPTFAPDTFKFTPPTGAVLANN